MPNPPAQKQISLFVGLRQELAKLHSLLRNEETAVEEVVRERVGKLHDILGGAQANLATLNAEVLRKIKAKLQAGSDEFKAVEQALSHVDEYRKAIEDERAAQEAAQAAQAAAADKSAAAQVLDVPAKEVAVSVAPAPAAAPVVDTPAPETPAPAPSAG